LRNKNKIYLLEIREGYFSEDSHPRYDYYDSWVVIAPSPDMARKMCGHSDEGDIWTNPHATSCKEIGISRLKPQVVCSSFNAG